VKYTIELTDALGENHKIIAELTANQIADVQRQYGGGSPHHPLAMTYARMNVIHALPAATTRYLEAAQ
jgi:hypothetical protein